MAFDKDKIEAEKIRLEEDRKTKLAAKITDDYLKRRADRRSVENGWQLNMNFLSGNQYCDVSPFGEVYEEDKQFYWQSRRVFNHIAPLIDARIAKILQRKPALMVKAFSDEDGDRKSAAVATGILRYVDEKIHIDDVLARGTVWAETCGVVFYKAVWNTDGGRQVAIDDLGNPVYEGEVDVTVVPPFEIFPDRLNAESMDELDSLIHAQAVSVDYVFEKFGVRVLGEDLSDTGISGYSEASAGKVPVKMGMSVAPAIEEGVVLIERYTRPNAEYKEGRLEIVAGNTLLYEGPLPYLNGERGERIFPFVKQDSLRAPGAFFSGSTVDRLIPVQRAYNAVRNRKHEFLNRLATGVLTVEDGSVDTDELAEEGLSPGRVLVYRQGGKAPEMLDCGKIPAEFAEEEEWLESEFGLVSGVSDLSQSSTPVRVTSATGLQLLLSQDDSRMAATLDGFRSTVKELSRQILCLYRQFAGSARLMSLTGENKKTEVYYFNAAEVIGDDIRFECNDKETPFEKREVLLRLLEAGILTDDDGKISRENKNKILSAFGFEGYGSAQDIHSLHATKANEENLELKKQSVEPDSYDDHELHINEHIRYLLSSEFKAYRNREEMKKRFIEHIDGHKKLQNKEEKGGMEE